MHFHSASLFATLEIHVASLYTYCIRHLEGNIFRTDFIMIRNDSQECRVLKQNLPRRSVSKRMQTKLCLTLSEGFVFFLHTHTVPLICKPRGSLQRVFFSLGRHNHTRIFPHVNMDRIGLLIMFSSFFFEAFTTQSKGVCALNAANLIFCSTVCS